MTGILELRSICNEYSIYRLQVTIWFDVSVNTENDLLRCEHSYYQYRYAHFFSIKNISNYS
jgi:hypothetical protein